MKKTALYIIFFLGSLSSVFSQALFPHIDPASLVPKGVLGIRLANEGYDELGQFRSQQSLRFMFGLAPKWMLTQSFSFSNHHAKDFPPDFIQNDGTIGYHTHGVKKGKKYPYLFESLNLNVKYRFLSIDGEKKHFRMAAYVEAAGGNEAHDEAEPSLMGDNGGIGAGITATKLHQRFAISGNVGGILPQNYYYERKDSSVRVSYGKALSYGLSMGLLCLPFKYKDYNQTNMNIYLEFVGKAYEGAKVFNKGQEVLISNVPGLEKGYYLECRPSMQFIFRSNLRIDLSVGFPVINRSYVHTSPVYFFTLQRYFYFK